MFGLTADQYFLFLEVHVKHLKACGDELRKKRCLSKIKDIKWCDKDECIKVYYQDEWFHYTKKHEWY